MSFQFKQFSVVQEKSAMKVGTDGVLLGAWANSEGKRMLDIGTGTGLIALMMAQRNSSALIDAVEIDQMACVEANDNFQNSKWNNRLNCIESRVQNFSSEFSYDSIICNPPYFVNATKAPQKARNTARHAEELTFEELVLSVKKLLSPEGTFSVILPTEEANLLVEIANSNGLFLSKKCAVKPKKDKAVKRLLLEFTRTRKALEESSVVIETSTRHKYTKEYISLTKEFYLNL